MANPKKPKKQPKPVVPVHLSEDSGPGPVPPDGGDA